MSDDNFYSFLLQVFNNIKNILNTYNSYYICCSDKNIDIFIQTLKENKFVYSNQIIWNKNNSVLGLRDYNFKHELILYGWKDRHKFYSNGFFKTTVWDIAKPLKNDLHPTMKPIELIVNAILNSSLENMIVFDGFLGSGSTLIACEHTNRICYGMEIEPHYCSVIINRWQKYTNKKAIKIKG